MKKIAALLLALIMALSLCACGSDSSLEKKIIGIWHSKDSVYMSVYDAYAKSTLSLDKDGTCVLFIYNAGTFDQLGEKTVGTWSVEKKDGQVEIVIKKLEGLNRVYNGNKLSLIYKDGTIISGIWELEKAEE